MAKKLYEESDIQGIADAIREKNKTTNTYKVREMANAIIDIECGTPNLQSKSVTYTSNGTATITPDSRYDGLSSVDVTANVASGGGGGVSTITLNVVDWFKNELSSFEVIDMAYGNTIVISADGTYTVPAYSIIVIANYEFSQAECSGNTGRLVGSNYEWYGSGIIFIGTSDVTITTIVL